MPPAAVVVMIYNHCKGYMMYTDLEDTIMTDDIDLDEEYFDADKEYGEDKNPRLGRIVLRIVEKQIDDKEPDFVEKAYVALQKKGYVRKLAKVKLGTALANEIFEVLKYNKPHKEKRYRAFVEEAVREKFDEKSVIDLETGREHTIAKRLEEFEELVMDVEDPGAAADLFIQLWPVLKQFVDDNYTRETEDGLRRFSPQQIDKSTDYRMNLYNSIMDSDMAFLNAKRYGDGVRVLGEILDTFAWLPGEDSSLRGGIGECLERSGKKEEADSWFRSWFTESPKDPDCANYYGMILMDRGEMEKAGQLLQECMPEGLPAKDRYINLYTRAEEFYRSIGEKSKEKEFAALLKKITRGKHRGFGGGGGLGYGGGSIFGGGQFFGSGAEKAAVKIYPNDPCPCGSGKKYKKCCGKNK